MQSRKRENLPSGKKTGELELFIKYGERTNNCVYLSYNFADSNDEGYCNFCCDSFSRNCICL